MLRCVPLGWSDLDQDQWSKITRIIVHERNRWIRDQSGFIGSFDAPWSEWSWIADPDPDHQIFWKYLCFVQCGLSSMRKHQELLFRWTAVGELDCRVNAKKKKKKKTSAITAVDHSSRLWLLLRCFSGINEDGIGEVQPRSQEEGRETLGTKLGKPRRKEEDSLPFLLLPSPRSLQVTHVLRPPRKQLLESCLVISKLQNNITWVKVTIEVY